MLCLADRYDDVRRPERDHIAMQALRPVDYPAIARAQRLSAHRFGGGSGSLKVSRTFDTAPATTTAASVEQRSCRKVPLIFHTAKRGSALAYSSAVPTAILLCVCASYITCRRRTCPAFYGALVVVLLESWTKNLVLRPHRQACSVFSLTNWCWICNRQMDCCCVCTGSIRAVCKFDILLQR